MPIDKQEEGVDETVINFFELIEKEKDHLAQMGLMSLLLELIDEEIKKYIKSNSGKPFNINSLNTEGRLKLIEGIEEIKDISLIAFIRMFKQIRNKMTHNINVRLKWSDPVVGPKLVTLKDLLSKRLVTDPLFEEISEEELIIISAEIAVLELKMLLGELPTFGKV